MVHFLRRDRRDRRDRRGHHGPHDPREIQLLLNRESDLKLDPSIPSVAPFLFLRDYQQVLFRALKWRT